ncbi:DUF4054 domain-containing protein [Kaistia algarum]|uniref:DUF4054 domain-containing protein n=1 Tax=Kaistia algarum TaxID=2083279 RepID=UPI000CE8DA6B|nr:DUF4054 domain-containing protein [Kaistia algarum]MCX5516229.1 DUF4054 domain-containing protein [Kaistia algarum]PPE78301.1 DUF4054 domain-containing protein [Kaistia algarum]
MTATVQTFLAHFPEFADQDVFRTETIQFWLDLAAQMLPADRWGTVLDTGIELYAAHNVALAGPAYRAGQNGGSPGQSSGPVASKTVDKVSVSYDTGAGTLEGAGAWNLTTYGVRFQQLARMFGAGGIQL